MLDQKNLNAGNNSTLLNALLKYQENKENIIINPAPVSMENQKKNTSQKVSLWPFTNLMIQHIIRLTKGASQSNVQHYTNQGQTKTTSQKIQEYVLTSK